MDSFWEPIIIENDELKKLKYLVHRLRQDVVNCACDIIHAQSESGLKKKAESVLFNLLDEKRRHLDNIERALVLAETYNYELMEKGQLALLTEEENKANKQLKTEEALEALRVKKQRLQGLIFDRNEKYNSEIELLKVILYELGTIRNCLFDPDEYDKIK